MTQSASGRPLRFFAIIMAGWVTLRLFSTEAMPPIASRPSAHVLQDYTPAKVPRILSKTGRIAIAAVPSRATTNSQNRVAFSRAKHHRPAFELRRQRQSPGPLSLRTRPSTVREDMSLDMMNFIHVSVTFADRHYASDPNDMNSLHAITASPPPIMTAQPMTDRWRAGAWLLWRPDGAPDGNAVPGGRLGSSQIGLRLEYGLTTGARPRAAAFGRLTSALRHPAAPEAAVGLSVQPARNVPVSVALERRIALGAGGRNANALMGVGGFGPTTIAPAIQAEAYAQAGMVGFRRRDGFVDGKFSLSTPISQTPFRLGVALSGGAQPGVSRLDIGPELQYRLPLPQIGARISIEWRERIAGHARPGSGLAVTLSADF